MNWLFYALLAAFFNGIADIFFKLVNGKIHNGLSGLIINLCSLVPVLVFTLYSKFTRQTIFTSREGIIYSIIAGLSIGCITLATFKMFNSGPNLSLAIPVMRIGVVLFAVLSGVFLFRDAITPKYIFGIILSIFGLYLIINST